MDNSEKKRYLGQLHEVEDEIRDIEREIKYLRDSNNYPSSVPFDREYVTGSKDVDNSAQAKVILVITEMEEQLDQKRILCMRLRTQIHQVLATVSDTTYRRILRKKYVLGMKSNQLAREIGYSQSRTSELLSMALDAFEMPSTPIWI